MRRPTVTTTSALFVADRAIVAVTVGYGGKFVTGQIMFRQDDDLQFHDEVAGADDPFGSLELSVRAAQELGYTMPESIASRARIAALQATHN